MKSFGYQAFGAMISLLFCPQFGLGFMEGHGLSHYFRMMGDWACAAFCGSLFLSSAMVSAMIGMQGEELSWIWRRYKSPLIFIPAFLWALMMLGNVTLDLPKENWDYHLIWIVTAILIQGMSFYSYQLFKNLKVDKF
jgi:hypothetical protein